MTIDLAEAVKVLRDEVLDTVEHGDRDPPGTEFFDAVVNALSLGVAGESLPGLDLALHDAVSRRLAWGDGEEVVLADAELVFDRLLTASERALRDPADRMVIIEAATQVAVTVARVVSQAAVARATRDRADRLREEMSQRQLKEVLEKQKANIIQLEGELKVDFT
ncbi:MAG: hypothetical protein H0T79_20570 [Deltaproteobacteria bacterium]|nr:hypothetical protein [Deltaproteobacteria bacterium]